MTASPEAPTPVDRERGSRVAHAWSTFRAWLGLVAGPAAYVAWALFRWWQSSGTGQGVWQDTQGYLTQAAAPLGSLDFWAGARAPGLPLVMRIAGSDPARVVGIQIGVSIVAWAVLALAAGACVRPGWRRAVASGLVLALACTRPVTQWDRQLLTESLSLSTLAVCTAALLWFARRRDAWSGAALVLAATAWLSLRDTHALVVGLTGVVVLVVAVVAGRRSTRDPVAGHRPGAEVTVLVVVGVLLVGIAFVGQAAADHGRRGVGPIAGVYATRVLPFADRRDWFADRGMPQARDLRVRARDARDATPAGAAVVVNAFPGDAELDRYTRWLTDHGTSTLLRYAVTHPGYVVGEPFVRPGRDFNNLGRWANYVAVDHDVAVLGLLVFPPWPWVLAVALLAVAVTVARRRWATTWPVVWWVTVGWGLVGLVHLLAAWHGDAQEVTRHVLLADVQVRLAVLLAVGWAVDALGRPAAVSATGPPATDGPTNGPPGRGRRRSG